MTLYEFQVDAYLDLQDILARLDTFNPSAATRFLQRLDHTLNVLAEFPGAGRARPEFGHTQYWYFFLSPYVIAYDPATTPLEVVGIRHASQATHPFPRS